MTGPLDMGTKSISNLPTPTTSSEATSKQYVDGQLNLKIGSVVADMIETEVRLKNMLMIPITPQVFQKTASVM